jgi:hypothetical protein
VDVTVSADGNFTGYWVVDDWCILGNSYIINATDDNDLWAEFNFTVVPEAIEIRPNSGVYSLGETITFTIKATFAKIGSELEIRDPNDELYFKTKFDAGDWSKVDAWQVVRISYQLDDASLYPYIIPTDAAIGTWNWTMYDTDDEIIESGLIEVIPTTAEQVNERLTSVEEGLASLGDDIDTVNADLSDKIDSVTDEINDVKGDIAGVKTDVASVKGDVASAKAAADAAKASADSALDAISDVADTADDAKTSADSAKSAADAAKASADDAKTAASGLTTLVYGAIGASLIAALAAIVSLMQISRRIAG